MERASHGVTGIKTSNWAPLAGVSFHCTERLWVQFLFRADAWVVGFLPSQGAYGRRLICVSFSN